MDRRMDKKVIVTFFILFLFVTSIFFCFPTLSVTSQASLSPSPVKHLQQNMFLVQAVNPEVSRKDTRLERYSLLLPCRNDDKNLWYILLPKK